MEILILILKSVFCYFLLMFCSTNLLGVVVRGIFAPKKELVDAEILPQENLKTGRFLTIVFLGISIIYHYFLYKYWGIGILLAALILIVARLPDLLHEIRTGKKVSVKNNQKTILDFGTSLLSWLPLPLILYSFYN